MTAILEGGVPRPEIETETKIGREIRTGDIERSGEVAPGPLAEEGGVPGQRTVTIGTAHAPEIGDGMTKGSRSQGTYNL